MRKLWLVLAFLILPALPAAAQSGTQWLVQAQAAARAGNFDESLRFYNLAIDSDQLRPAAQVVALNGRGLVYYRTRNFPLAVADYTQALQIDPNAATVLRNRCFAYIEMNNWPLAQADCEASAQRTPDDAQGADTLGYVFMRQRLYNVALEHFDRAIALNPNYGPAYMHRGYTLYQLGDRVRARQDMQKAQELMPGNPELAREMQRMGLMP